MVLQPPLIFPIAVRYNLVYGRPAATQPEIERAVKLANIHGLIKSLPKGYDTVIGEPARRLPRAKSSG